MSRLRTRFRFAGPPESFLPTLSAESLARVSGRGCCPGAGSTRQYLPLVDKQNLHLGGRAQDAKNVSNPKRWMSDELPVLIRPVGSVTIGVLRRSPLEQDGMILENEGWVRVVYSPNLRVGVDGPALPAT